MRDTIKQWTGEYQETCAWRAFMDPFVVRVLDAHRWFESGQLEFAYPSASNRLVEGISFYNTVSQAVYSKQLKKEADEREAKRRFGG